MRDRSQPGPLGLARQPTTNNQQPTTNTLPYRNSPLTLPFTLPFDLPFPLPFPLPYLTLPYLTLPCESYLIFTLPFLFLPSAHCIALTDNTLKAKQNARLKRELTRGPSTICREASSSRSRREASRAPRRRRGKRE